MRTGSYRDLVQRRIALIESHPYIRLLERPEYKRRWATEPWERQEERALRGWLLDRLEDKRFWFDRAGRPTPRSVAQLADDVARDSDLVSVLGLWEGRPDVPVVGSLEKLFAEESVPYLAAYRYKDVGLRKREAWEHTWDLQRQEDDYEDKKRKGILPKDAVKSGPSPVPPKYTCQVIAGWSSRRRLGRGGLGVPLVHQAGPGPAAGRLDVGDRAPVAGVRASARAGSFLGPYPGHGNVWGDEPGDLVRRSPWERTPMSGASRGPDVATVPVPGSEPAQRRTRGLTTGQARAARP